MKTWMVCLLLLLTVPAWAGFYPDVMVLATGVTTNITSTPVAVVNADKRTFWAEVICSSGACTQTVEIYGARENAAANGLLLCTITLSGTPRDQDACAVSTAAYPFYYVVTSNTTGTGAAGSVYAFY